MRNFREGDQVFLYGLEYKVVQCCDELYLQPFNCCLNFGNGYCKQCEYFQKLSNLTCNSNLMFPEELTDFVIKEKAKKAEKEVR